VTTQHHAGHSGHMGAMQTDGPAVHRWVVFGAERIYLSHLSMFSMHEHAMQVIVEAEFVERNASPSTAYRDDRRHHPAQRLYTLDPAVFVLPEILPTGSEPPARTTLRADLYRDHVEKDNPAKELIAEGIDVHILRVVHAHRYEPHPQPLSDLEYVLFGDVAEPYLAHFVTRPPDFDQILRVMVDGELSAKLLAAGSRLTIPGRANTLVGRLEEGEATVPAILHSGGSDIAVGIQPEVEFYGNSDADLQ
jgi:hypothetical protein